MVHPNRQALLSSVSLAMLSISFQLSPSTIPLTALAFTSTSPTSLTTRAASNNFKSLVISNRASRLFYQAPPDAYTVERGTSPDDAGVSSEGVAETTALIDDSNYEAILQNPLGRPVLVDCFVPNCGPCKLIERSLQAVLPGYSDELSFCKWNADETEHSQQFMNLLREHEMTFRKLPTLIMFVDGAPVALRSGMGTAGQLKTFLEDHLHEKECVDEVTLNGEKFLCED